MKPIKAIIVEDEQLSAEKLELLLSRSGYDITVMGRIASVAEAKRWLPEHTVDLIFMDIQLADGNAFEIFEEVAVTTPIIFVTAYDEYALAAFQEFGIDYLLKPVTLKDIKRALGKLNRFHPNAAEADLQALFERLNPSGQSRFIVHTGGAMKAIQSQEIAYFFAEEGSVFLVTDANNRYLMSETLERLEQLTPGYFFRTNRKTLININKIKTIRPHTYGRLSVELEVETGFDIVIPLERVGNFKNSLIRD